MEVVEMAIKSRVELSENEKCVVVAPKGYFLRVVSGQTGIEKRFAMIDVRVKIDLIKR
jgi:hypothetical protein